MSDHSSKIYDGVDIGYLKNYLLQPQRPCHFFSALSLPLRRLQTKRLKEQITLPKKKKTTLFNLCVLQQILTSGASSHGASLNSALHPITRNKRRVTGFRSCGVVVVVVVSVVLGITRYLVSRRQRTQRRPPLKVDAGVFGARRAFESRTP